MVMQSAALFVATQHGYMDLHCGARLQRQRLDPSRTLVDASIEKLSLRKNPPTSYTTPCLIMFGLIIVAGYDVLCIGRTVQLHRIITLYHHQQRRCRNCTSSIGCGTLTQSVFAK